jgi:conjugative transfer signal peptidase TraF
MLINARPLVIMIGVFLILAVIEAGRNLIECRYWLNLSRSEPVGLYVVTPLNGNLKRGETVLMKCPEGFEKYLYGRKWLPEGWPLFKTVGAVPGDTFCISQTELAVQGKTLGPVYSADRKGLPMPVIRGCRTVREDHFLPVATGLKSSFDGRYFGAVPVSTVIGKTRPVLLFHREGK